MKALASRYYRCFKEPRFVVSLVLSALLLFGSLIVNFYAGLFALHSVSNSVTDVLLDNLPVFDVDWFFIYGPVILWAVVAMLALKRPARGPFILQSISLFILIRAGFVTLTHIGPFPDQIAIDYSSAVLRRFTFGGDLFFSAHTGMPFLMALVFGRERLWHWLFILTSIFFGAVVLLGHLHYSIDVASAFFITYSIYHLALRFFAREARWFAEGTIT